MNPIVGPRTARRDATGILALRSTRESPFGFNYSRRRRHWNRRLKGGHFALKTWLQGSRHDIWSVDVHGSEFLRWHDVPRADVIVNTIADAELEPEALGLVARWLDEHPELPVINHPLDVLQTTRVRNHERLGKLPGVLFPRTRIVRVADDPRVTAEAILNGGFTCPLILRRPATQTGRSVVRVKSADELAGRLAHFGSGERVLVIQYHDARRDRRTFHKARCFFVDGVFYPIASLSNDTWQTHSGDRYRLMAGSPQSKIEERHYLEDPESFLGKAAFARLHDIARVIELDWFGIDFTVMPDGRVLVFEANAAMRHNLDHADNFPYTRPHLLRASDAFQRMLGQRIAESRQST